MTNYFVNADNDGFITGYYNDDVHDSIPDTAKPITPEQWQGALDMGANKFIGGEFINFVSPITDEQARAAFKQNRANLIAVMTVTVDSMVFDADKEARDNITTAVTALEPLETQLWVLADNTDVLVTREQLKQVLRAIGAMHTDVWVQQI